MGTDGAAEITRLLERVSVRDDRATHELTELLYREMRALAQSYLRGQAPSHTLQATALAHEAYLRLFGGMTSHFNNREHFFAVAATAMRQILAEHARRKRTAKRGGDWSRITLSDAADSTSEIDIDIIALDDALTELAAADERKARIVQLKFFADMTMEEIARVLDVSLSTVEAEWRFGRAWLAARLHPDPAP